MLPMIFLRTTNFKKHLKKRFLVIDFVLLYSSAISAPSLSNWNEFAASQARVREPETDFMSARGWLLRSNCSCLDPHGSEICKVADHLANHRKLCNNCYNESSRQYGRLLLSLWSFETQRTRWVVTFGWCPVGYPEAAWNLCQSSTNGCWWHHFFVDTVQQQNSVRPQKGGSSRWIVQLFAEWVGKCRYMQLLMVGYTVLITHGFLEAPRPNNHMIIMGVTSKDPWRCETNCGSNKWVCWEAHLSHAGQQHVYGIDILMVKLDTENVSTG